MFFTCGIKLLFAFQKKVLTLGAHLGHNSAEDSCAATGLPHQKEKKVAQFHIFQHLYWVKENVARAMLSDNAPIQKIQKYTGLTLSEIEALQK